MSPGLSGVPLRRVMPRFSLIVDLAHVTDREWGFQTLCCRARWEGPPALGWSTGAAALNDCFRGSNERQHRAAAQQAAAHGGLHRGDGFGLDPGGRINREPYKIVSCRQDLHLAASAWRALSGRLR